MKTLISTAIFEGSNKEEFFPNSRKLSKSKKRNISKTPTRWQLKKGVFLFSKWSKNSLSFDNMHVYICIDLRIIVVPTFTSSVDTHGRATLPLGSMTPFIPLCFSLWLVHSFCNSPGCTTDNVTNTSPRSGVSGLYLPGNLVSCGMGFTSVEERRCVCPVLDWWVRSYHTSLTGEIFTIKVIIASPRGEVLDVT